mgnify:CR=1 FL=1
MVRIEFLGAWKDKDVQAVRDVTVTGIEKKLKISVLHSRSQNWLERKIEPGNVGKVNTLS